MPSQTTPAERKRIWRNSAAELGCRYPDVFDNLPDFLRRARRELEYVGVTAGDLQRHPKSPLILIGMTVCGPLLAT